MSTKNKQRAKKIAIVLLGVSSVATLGLTVSQGDLPDNDEIATEPKPFINALENISFEGAFTGKVKEVISQSSIIIDGELTESSAEAVKRRASIPNDGQYEKVRVLATGYTAGPESTGKDPSHPAYGITYSGVYVRRDINSISTIAADPKVFPLGTILYIPGYGYGIVADTGSAIKGDKIDLYYETVEEVYNEWGKKYVDVFVIKRGDGRVTETILEQYFVDRYNRITTVNFAS